MGFIFVFRGFCQRGVLQISNVNVDVSVKDHSPESDIYPEDSLEGILAKEDWCLLIAFVQLV